MEDSIDYLSKSKEELNKLCDLQYSYSQYLHTVDPKIIAFYQAKKNGILYRLCLITHMLNSETKPTQEIMFTLFCVSYGRYFGTFISIPSDVFNDKFELFCNFDTKLI